MRNNKKVEPHSLEAVYLEYKRKSRAGLLGSVPTGFKKIDDLLGGGLLRGSLYIICGKPGIGKSTFCVQMMYQMLEKGYNVIYVTTIGEEWNLSTKLLYLAYMFDQKKVNGKVAFNLTQARDNKFKDVKESAKKLLDKWGKSIFFARTSSMEEVKRVVEAVPKPILIIDFIQDMQIADEYQHYDLRKSAVLSEITELKNNFYIPIIGIPMDDAEYYEDDATAFFLLTEDDVCDIKSDPDTKPMVLECIKNRFGERGEIRLKFYPEYAFFEEEL
jgi:replicative DNA helicase